MNKNIGPLSFISLRRSKNALLLCCCLFLFTFLIRNGDKCTNGFISGYTAANGLLKGEDVKTYYNNDDFAQLVSQFCAETYDIYSPNPPTYSLMMIPLAVFNFSTAKVIWTIINLLMIWLIARLIKENLTKMGLVEILLVILLFQPLYTNLRFGQNYVFILLMVTLIWVGWKHDKTWMMVVGLVLMTGFKLGLVWLWPLLLLNGKWKAIIYSGLTLLLIFAVSLPFIELETWAVFLDELSAVSSKESGAVTAYQTIPGFFRHLFTSHPDWNPVPIFEQPFLGGIFHKILTLGLIVASLVISKLAKSKNLKIALIAIISVITSPFTLDYHYPVLIIAFLLIYEVLKDNKEKLIVLVAYACIALPLPYKNSMLSEGYLSLLAYPKLYGAIVLMVLCIYKMWQEIRVTKIAQES
jgi:hypothetical protein